MSCSYVFVVNNVLSFMEMVAKLRKISSIESFCPNLPNTYVASMRGKNSLDILEFIYVVCGFVDVVRFIEKYTQSKIKTLVTVYII